MCWLQDELTGDRFGWRQAGRGALVPSQLCQNKEFAACGQESGNRKTSLVRLNQFVTSRAGHELGRHVVRCHIRVS